MLAHPQVTMTNVDVDVDVDVNVDVGCGGVLDPGGFILREDSE